MNPEVIRMQPSDSEDKSKSKPSRRSRKRLILLLFALVVVAILGVVVWAGFDLYGPRTSHMRDFDPDEVARLETAMWRSYYDKQQVRLFNQLTELLRTQYNMPLVRSNRVAYHAAKAAFIFKDGKQRSDYEKALPELIEFYTAIREISDIPFDVNRVAHLELEWWIIHRERAKHPEGDLDRALADLQAEIYHVPAESLMEHARLRAEAMRIRDSKAEVAGKVTEEDWARIGELLRRSWRSLFNAVKPQNVPH